MNGGTGTTRDRRDAIPDWVVCEGCRSVLYGKKFLRALGVCPDCGHHGRLGAADRLTALLDPGSAVPLLPPVAAGAPADTVDPLEFTDTRPYPQRVAAARDSTGLDEAVLCARGRIGGHDVVAAAMDFRFLGGSLGSAVGELVTLAAEEALATRTPFLVITASGGARMQEGPLSLMQMAKTSGAFARLDEAGVLTVCVVTDPTYGGVAASYATLGDVVLAETGARLGFAGPRVIEQTIRQRLPEGFQRAGFLLERGLLDGVHDRAALRPVLARLLAAYDAGPVRRTPVPPAATAGRPVTDPGRLPERDAWDVVGSARRLDRPTTLDYAARLLEDFEELHGDRVSGRCPAIVGGLGRLDGTTVMLIGHQKAHDASELAARNYGMAQPSGYRKAGRLMRLAAKLEVPVVTLVDTPGAYPGISAEEQGQAMAIAESLRLMSSLPVPVVSVIIGEGGSGGALGLAVADRVLVCENAVYSVISPEGCAAILWKDRTAAPRAASALGMVPRELLRLGIVDGVVPEPPGGAHTDWDLAATHLRTALWGALRPALALSPRELVDARHARYRRMVARGAGEHLNGRPVRTTAPTDTPAPAAAASARPPAALADPPVLDAVLELVSVSAPGLALACGDGDRNGNGAAKEALCSTRC